MPTEATIVRSLKKHLQAHGLGAQHWAVSDIAVDSDGAYLREPFAAELEPMMSMPIQGFHPDLVCAYGSPEEEGLAAFEVKARFDDWMKGVTQARAYREGVHRAYIALPEDKAPRLSALKNDAKERGVGVWLLGNSMEAWEEAVAPAPPRPGFGECRKLAAALRGVALPRRLQLNHPLNYLAVAWARYCNPDLPLISALKMSWKDLRRDGSRKHAINGARYLGLLAQDGTLTMLGVTVCDLMKAFDFNSAAQFSKKRRLADESPGLAAISRLVLLQQESAKLVVEALQRSGARALDTEQLMREAAQLNRPLASGLFLSDPSAADERTIPSSCFSQSFVFQFKQSLYHAGILATPSDKSAGKGATQYQHKHDMWRLDGRLAHGVVNGGANPRC